MGYKVCFPEQDDTSFTEKHDVALTLPAPIMSKGTDQLEFLFSFQINLSAYNVR